MAVSKDNAKKTMDVSKPGESAPDSSARPVIVTHRPMMQDPMMKSEIKPDDTPVQETPKALESIHADRVIQPISETTDDKEEPKSVNTTDANKPAEEKPESEVATDEPKPDEPKPETTTEQPDTKQKEEAQESATVDAIADQVELKSKKKDDKPSPEEIAKQEALQKLIKDKKYFVAIGQVAHRKSQRTAMAFFVFLIALIALYSAIDAGLININVALPFDLIPN